MVPRRGILLMMLSCNVWHIERPSTRRISWPTKYMVMCRWIHRTVRAAAVPNNITPHTIYSTKYLPVSKYLRLAFPVRAVYGINQPQRCYSCG